MQKYGEATGCPGTAVSNPSVLLVQPVILQDEFNRFGTNVSCLNVCLVDGFTNWSQDELRLVDYEKGNIKFDLVG